jgi:hypothetical protein
MSITLITSVVSAALLGLSEVLSYVKQIKSNGIFQLIVDLLTSHKDKDNTQQNTSQPTSQDGVLNGSTTLNQDVNDTATFTKCQKPQIYINNLIYISSDVDVEKQDEPITEP